MELASQTRSGAFALGIRAMAHRAGWNAGFRNPFLIEFFPGGHLVLGGALQRSGIQIFEMRRISDLSVTKLTSMTKVTKYDNNIIK